MPSGSPSSPPVVGNEAERLAALESYHLLDTLPEQALDDLTALAAHICGSPIALITLVTENRQWFKSKVGIEINETSREVSICAHTLKCRKMLVVNDSKLDERFANNPLVTEDPYIRFYAGAPLIAPDDHVLGTLCVMDHEPRELTPSQLEALQTLSRQVMAQLELRRQSFKLQESESLFRNVFEHASAGICVFNFNPPKFLEVNQRFCDFLGYTESELIGRTFSDITHPDDLPQSMRSMRAFMSGEISEFRMEKRYIRKDGREVWALANIVAVKSPATDPLIAITTIEDITERKATESLTQAHNQVLKMIASGEALSATLDALLKLIERHSPHTPCSVLLLDSTGQHLIHGAGSGLDDAYSHAIDGIEIGPSVGSCGTAAFLKQPVFAEDITSDAHWENYRELALAHDLKACWSTPIFSETQELLGTFSIYSPEPGLPTDTQLGLIELATQTAAIAISRDRNEASLRASEARYRTIMDSMMESCQLIGFDWRYLYLNDKYGIHVRRPNSEVLGQRLQDVWPGIEETKVFALLKRSMDERLEIQKEIEFGFPDGTSSWFDVRCQPVPEGIFVLSIDITARKKADDELLTTQRNLSSIINTVDGIVWEADAETFQFTYVSPQAERMLGYPVSEWTEGKTFWSDHIHPEDREKAVGYCMTNTREKKDHEFEYRMRRSDGNYLYLRDIVAVIVEEGQPIKLRGLMVDITEHRQLQDRLRESQKMEAVGQLAGGIAHDFNNILTALMMQIELVRNNAQLPDDARELIGEMKAATKRAAALTSQLLAFGRRQVLQKEAININESVTNLSKMLLRVLPESVPLIIHLSPKPLYTNADSGMFDQVLLNLVVNARDAMVEGGSITIDCTAVTLNDDDARVITGATEGDYVRVTVTDTGTGIPQELITHVFEPFYTTKEVGKGTGLGLATVFGILKQHGGAIQVESSPDHGAKFHIYWPTLVIESPEIAVAVTAPSRVGGHETILIVEDEPSVRSMTKILLEKQGYRIEEAENGVEALELWSKKNGEIDLVLTDMVMPEGISGKELADTLRRDNPQLRVVFTSGYSPEIAGQKLKLMPGQRFIPKPCPIHELLTTVRSCLDETIVETA